MSLASGALSSGVITATTAEVITAAGSGGTTPYSYQLYRSLVSGFTPGGGNIIAGGTTLDYVDSGLVPGTQYYYASIVTDSAATPAHATSSQLSVLTSNASQSQNQFVQSAYLGMLDLQYNPDTIAAQIDNGQVGSLVAGQPVKFTQDAGGVPKVEACAANTDIVAGFLTYNIKNKHFVALDYCEMSMDQNVMFLMATAAVARGAKLMIDVSTVGGVITATTGKPICGFALDVASAGGQLIRVKLMTPSYQTVP